MEIDWSKQEASGLMRKFYEVANLGATIDERRKAVMGWASEVVSAFLARASGQVKEDAAVLGAILDYARQSPKEQSAAMEALPRLQALAQESASLEAKVAELEKDSEDYDADIRELKRAIAYGVDVDSTKRRNKYGLITDLYQAYSRMVRIHKSDAETYGSRMDALRAEVERLKANLDQAPDIATLLRRSETAESEMERLKAEIGAIHTSVFTGMEEPMITDDGHRIVSEVDALKRRAAELGDLARRYKEGRTEARTRAESAESRLAAIRECLMDMAAEDDTDAPVPADFKAGWHAARKHVAEVLEGDAPNTSIPSNGSVGDPTILNTCVCGDLLPDEHCLALRHPCSPTCTHDDAANPGHPERIESLSVAFAQPMPETCVLASDEPIPVRVKERREALHAAMLDAEWNDRTYTEWTCWNDGAEAMRAACWEAVQVVLQKHGWTGEQVCNDFKAAIDGATT